MVYQNKGSTTTPGDSKHADIDDSLASFSKLKLNIGRSIKGKKLKLIDQSDRQNEFRLLFVSKDKTLLEEGSASDKHMKEIATLFDEIHIIVLIPYTLQRQDVIRRTQNIWIYQSSSKKWWANIFLARKIARKQLSFANGFRADVVIAEDPFECGVAGHLIAHEFGKPLQINIGEDFTRKQLYKNDLHNFWRSILSRYTFRRASCFRTKSQYLKERVLEMDETLRDVTEVQPVHYDLKAWRDSAPLFELRKRYPQFKFIILHISSVSSPRYTTLTMSSMRRILKRYSSAGLVIIDYGLDRNEHEMFAKKLGIEKQVVFEIKSANIVSYMKAANVLMYISEEMEQEITLLQAAAVGLPVVSSAEGLAGELFLDGQSALLCPTESIACYGEKVNALINNDTLGVSLSSAAKDVVFEHTQEDYGSYLEAYKESIKRCLISDGLREV